MPTVLALGPEWLDPETVLGRYGLPAVVAIVFAECGLLVGFLLPGDTLLLSAGVLTRADVIAEPLWLVLLLIWLAAVAGNVCGYEIGAWLGPPVLRGGRLVRPDHVLRARTFFDRYGPLAIVAARYVAIVRTFITVVAGATGMGRATFVLWSAVGGAIWVVSLVLLGYALGDVPFVRDNVDTLVIGVIVLVVVLGIARAALERRRRRSRTATGTAPAAETSDG